MRSYVFPFGSSEWSSSMSITLSDRDAARLEASAHAEPRWHLDEDPDISDIYEIVRSAIFQANKFRMLQDGSLAELREWHPGEDISDDDLVEEDMGMWSICYPEELQHIEKP